MRKLGSIASDPGRVLYQATQESTYELFLSTLPRVVLR